MCITLNNQKKDGACGCNECFGENAHSLYQEIFKLIKLNDKRRARE